jgi:heme-degrading monooxygenase HmoA
MTAEGGYRVLIRMEIEPGAGTRFEQAWLEMSAIARRHPASRGQSLSRVADEPDVYYIVTDWADEAGFADFAASDGHAEGGRKLKELRRGGGRTAMSVVHRVPGHQVLSAT